MRLLNSTMKWSQPRRKGLLLQMNSSSRRNEKLESKQWSSHKFDETTGQIYTEKIASILSADDRDWTRRTRVVRGPSHPAEEVHSESIKAWEKRRKEGLSCHEESMDGVKRLGARALGGARSLQSIALESVLQNISDITLESIEHLPIQLVKRIWEVVNQRCIVSFDIWAIFSRLLHQDAGIHPAILRYSEAISTPRLPLYVYTKPLTSNSFNFITSLSITTPFPIPDLVRLSSIRNLGVLEITNTYVMKDSENTFEFPLGVGDRLIRAWHLAAVTGGAFSALRILKLWNHEELTGQSLVYLNGFPSLAVYDVKGCGFDRNSKIQARSLGWKPCIETNILGLLEDACDKRRAFMQARSSAEAKHTPEGRSRHLSGRSEARRIPRTELAAFITGRQSLKLEQISKKLKVDSETAQKELDRRRIYGLPRNKTVESWESTAYESFARIGELRNETDLERAGVTIGDQVIMGDDLLNSIPMVSLRLGQTPPSLPSIQTTRTSSSALSFIRIKAPSADTSHKGGSQDRAMLGMAATEFCADNMQSAHVVPVKQPGVGMINTKKRKLDDVLNSFF